MKELFTMYEKIEAVLEKIFLQYRLVFWYDDKSEMASAFNEMNLNGVKKININNNEFGIKHKVLVEDPNGKYLIFHNNKKPNDSENWLLDLNLAYYEFYTEPSSLLAQELGLPPELKNVVQDHIAFFNSPKRLDELRAQLEATDTERKLKLKILAITVSSETDWDKILYALFQDLSKGKTDKWKSVEKYNLADFFWETVKRKYGYDSEHSSLKDLLINLFQDHFNRQWSKGKSSLSKDAYLFMNRWKENAKAQSAFTDLSEQLGRELGMAEIIQPIPSDELLDADAFELIDQKVIISLRKGIQKDQLNFLTIQEWISKRANRYFYDKYKNIYQGLFFASQLLDEIKKTDYKFDTANEGFEKYKKQYHKVDYYYRKYIYFAETAEHNDVLKTLSDQIEKAYVNTFLSKLGDSWQSQLNKVTNWPPEKLESQRNFFPIHVSPAITNPVNKIYVIISDALRYESAVELNDRILQENRYDAELTSICGSIPSYTQLGMASLLPHNHLKVEEGKDLVWADGLSSQGTSNRTRILEKSCKGVAISAEEFLSMNAHKEGREFVKNYQVVYIYSNIIDKTGDDKISENKVFKSTEDEFNNLLKIIKQVANMNGSNMIITSDHGYLYQHKEVAESDFSEAKPGGNIWRFTRRFIIGKKLDANSALMKFHGEALGLQEDLDFLIPRSVTRLRVSGSGSRFVHGGASLQEIVIPVITINKKRKNDIEKVDIDILKTGSNITSNQFGIVFYQTQPANEKLLPRTLRCSFYSEDNKVISDILRLEFNSRETDSLAREKRHTFHFASDVTQLNGQDVKFRMEEQIDGAQTYRLYKEHPFRMLISFGSEFDDF